MQLWARFDNQSRGRSLPDFRYSHCLVSERPYCLELLDSGSPLSLYEEPEYSPDAERDTPAPTHTHIHRWKVNKQTNKPENKQTNKTVERRDVS